MPNITVVTAHLSHRISLSRAEQKATVASVVFFCNLSPWTVWSHLKTSDGHKMSFGLSRVTYRRAKDTQDFVVHSHFQPKANSHFMQRILFCCSPSAGLALPWAHPCRFRCCCPRLVLGLGSGVSFITTGLRGSILRRQQDGTEGGETSSAPEQTRKWKVLAFR